VGFSRETRAFKRLIYLAFGLGGLAAAAIVLTIFQLRQDVVEQAAREQTDLAIVLGREISQSSRAVEQTLDRLDAIVAKAAPRTPAEFRESLRTAAVHEALVAASDSTQEVDVATLLADNGEILNFSRSWPAPNVNDAHQDDFVYLSGHPGRGTYIGSPQRSNVSHEWLIYSGRRIETTEGRFLGVLHVGVKLGFYRSIYTNIAALKNKSFALRRRDGVLLVGYPDSSGADTSALPYASPWFQLLKEGGGAYEGADLPGRANDLVAVHPIDDAPLIVDVDQSLDSVLAPWRVRAAEISLGAVLALLCAGALARAAYRHFQRLLRSEASLVEKSFDLAMLNARFLAVLNNLPHGVALFDSERRVTIANRRYGEMYDLSPEDVKPGVTLDDILAKRVAKGIYVENAQNYVEARLKDIQGPLPSHSLDRLSNGKVFATNRRPLAEGGWLTVHEDVTARKRAEDRIEQMAWRDQLTGVANRARLMQEMTSLLEADGGAGSKPALILLDLDDFKGVNDTHGHPFGDALLKAVAERLTEAAGDCAIVARIGGDEFALLQENCESDEASAELAERVLAAIRQPFTIDDFMLTIRPSLGVARSPRDGHDLETLFKAADLALYAAKSGGRDRVGFYEPKLEIEMRDARALKVDLHEAIALGQLDLHFQPIVDTRTRRIVKMEALVRWRHPARGMVPPDVFIPLAEENGMIHELGGFVLLAACNAAMRWPPEIGVSVNLSPAQIARGDVIAVVHQALEDSGLPAHRLTLEITETALMENLETGNAILQAIRAMGARIALDDFGTGYSSLSYLQTFALDEIKIDRAFVAAMETQDRTREIVALIAAIARNLGAVTVAEGIETQKQLDLVVAAGCNAAQGYFFNRPKPVAELDFSASAAEKFSTRAA
jgi:diguanylate cyclase (GGDEF)-like protein